MDTMKTFESVSALPSVTRRAGAVSEVIDCMGLGIRDGMHPRLAFTSVVAALAALGMWLIVFLVWRTEIWGTASVATKWVVTYALALFGAHDVSGGWAAVASSAAWGLLNFILLAGILLVLVMLSVRVLLELFLMKRIQRQCLKRYPGLADDVKGSLRSDLLSKIGQWSALCAGVLLLVVPLIGGFFFFLLGSYLNPRGLVNDALEDLATVEERSAVVKAIRTPLFLLGVATTMLLLVPLAGLFVPVILGTSVCHLCIRALIRIREGNAGSAA